MHFSNQTLKTNLQSVFNNSITKLTQKLNFIYHHQKLSLVKLIIVGFPASLSDIIKSMEEIIDPNSAMATDIHPISYAQS